MTDTRKNCDVETLPIILLKNHLVLTAIGNDGKPCKEFLKIGTKAFELSKIYFYLCKEVYTLLKKP